MQRDIGNDAHRGDDRGHRGNREALAVARGQEIGDRSYLLGLGQLYDALEKRETENEDEEGSDINRQELQSPFRCETDGAEERPGRAVDRKAERIDVGPR